MDGKPGRLVLTEQDYEEYSAFRQILFSQLEMDLLVGDVLVIGQSLRDRHLRDLVGETARVKDNHGAPGRLFALVYERDDDRAGLLHRRGVTTCFAGIDEFLHELASTVPAAAPATPDDDERLLLKPALRIAAIDADQAVRRDGDAVRLFNGRPATYGDIAAGLTFQRSAESRIDAFIDGDPRFLTILGVAGVGKTSLARRVALIAREAGHYAWEYVRDFPLDHRDWLDVDTQLRERDRRGFLLVDDAPSTLRQVNLLAEALDSRGRGGLSLILTASVTQWRPRLKSPVLFSAGNSITLSELDEAELRDLVRLVDEKPEIRELIDTGFAELTGNERLEQLRLRARADMFVCLKNIFASEALDAIVLREYAELDESQQEIYRFVSALQAGGGRVHRQLVLRVLDVRADEILGLLMGLEGVVDEYEISAEFGLYAWETRHEVIAATIARYKYSDESELVSLFTRVIDNLNPTVHIELRSLREMCTSELGIQSLSDPADRIELYRRMIEAVPSERIPHHGLVRELLRKGELEAADQAIRRATEAVGPDRPLHRYQVRLELQRARSTQGIMEEDRIAILRVAERLALNGVERYADDKFAYVTYGEVAVALAERTGDLSALDDALREMSGAAERLLDPELTESLIRFERRREQFHEQSRRSAEGGRSS